MDRQRIAYENIHTKTKRLELAARIAEVSKIINERYPKLDRVTSCPCCTGKSLVFFAKKYDFDYDRCSDCNHIFTNPFPSSAALDYYYNSDFKVFENQFFLDSFDSRLPIFKKRLEILDKLSDIETILDVGSGVGLFIEANYCRQRQYTIHSCDLSTDACNKLTERYDNLVVFNSRLQDLQTARYDCVTLWDTIEHITEPDYMMKAVGAQLRQGGYFILSTPNTRSFEWEILQDMHVQLLPPGHVNLYNHGNISSILTRNGYSIVTLETLNPSLDLTYIEHYLKNSEPTIPCRAALMLLDIINSDRVSDVAEDYMRQMRMAGNMLVVAKKNV